MNKVKMNCPEGTTSCSVDGTEYTVDDKGQVSVPAGLVQHLAQFGFTQVTTESGDAVSGDDDAAEPRARRGGKKAAAAESGDAVSGDQ